MQSTIEKLDGLTQKLAARNILLASFLGVVFVMLGFQWLKGQLGTQMLDEIPGYDAEMLRAQMLLFGEAGRRLHMIFSLTLDMVFPLVYGAFFAGLLAVTARGLPIKALAAPVLAVMALDYAENIQLALMLSGFPDLGMAQIEAASRTTIAKFWAIRFALYWLSGLAVWRLVKTLRARAV